MAKFEKVNLLNYPIFFMTKETKCPYLGNKSEKRLVTDLNNNPFLFDELSLSGFRSCLLYTSPSPRDRPLSRMPSSA